MKEILSRLPYTKPFLFVDELLEIHADGAKGTYTFSSKLDFYKGHFAGNPVTPGVILTECCAQIGLVCLGIFLLKSEGKLSEGGRPIAEHPSPENLQIGLSSSEMQFLFPVFPDEKVTVTSQKRYFRFNKLKCTVKMHNEAGKMVCNGEIAGMIQSVSKITSGQTDL